MALGEEISFSVRCLYGAEKQVEFAAIRPVSGADEPNGRPPDDGNRITSAAPAGCLEVE